VTMLLQTNRIGALKAHFSPLFYSGQFTPF